MLAKNSPLGGFDTIDGVQDNISKLKKYVGNLTDINKVYRALNLLNAARMGYASTEEINTPKDKTLVKFRDELDSAYEELKEKGYELSLDSEEKIKKDIKKAPVEWLDVVRHDLKARLKESGPESKRPALEKFLALIDSEMGPEDKKSSLKISQNLNDLKNLIKDLKKFRY